MPTFRTSDPSQAGVTDEIGDTAFIPPRMTVTQVRLFLDGNGGNRYIGKAIVILGGALVLRRLLIFKHWKENGEISLRMPAIENTTLCQRCNTSNPLSRKNCLYCKEELPTPEERVSCPGGHIVCRSTEIVFPINRDLYDYLARRIQAAISATQVASLIRSIVYFGDDGTVAQISHLENILQFEEMRFTRPKRSEDESDA